LQRFIRLLSLCVDGRPTQKLLSLRPVPEKRITSRVCLKLRSYNKENVPLLAVIDSSAIREDFHLKGVLLTLLFDHRHAVNIDIGVPDVVIQETNNRYREQIQKSLSQHASACRDLTKLTHCQLPQPNIDIDKLVAQHERHLQGVLLQNGATPLPLPDMPQQSLLTRALRRKKPFNESGNGYRDTLIWETILAHATAHPNQRIAFITENTRDFCNKTDSLHDDLIADLTARSLPDDHVTIYTTLKDFVERELLAKLPKPHQSFVTFTQQHFPAFRLPEAVEPYLLSQLPGRSFSSKDLGQPEEYEDPTITGVGTPTNIKILDEIVSPSDKRVIEFNCDCECLFDCYIDKHEFWCMDVEEQPSATDWNETYMSAQFYATITIQGYAVFDPTKGDLTDFEITEIIGNEP
jgi:hypothetical protein